MLDLLSHGRTTGVLLQVGYHTLGLEQGQEDVIVEKFKVFHFSCA